MKTVTDDELTAAIQAHGVEGAARKLGINRRTVQRRRNNIIGKPTAGVPNDLAERRELSSLRSEVKRLQESAFSLSELKRFIGTLSNELANPPAWTVAAPKRAKIVHGVPTLMLSDLHFGETVFAGQVNGVNSYNIDVAKRRLRRVVDKSVKLLRETLAPGEFGGMVVIFGGDMLDGVIHDELRDTASETVMQQVITLHDELVPALKRLCDEFGRVHVPCVVGNHGRLDRKPRMKNGPFLNFDWLLYRLVARTMGGDPKYRDRVTFQIPDGFDCSYRVFGVRYMLTHGDSFRGGNGITGPLLPWMRGDHKTRKQYGAIGMPYDVLVMGHWHQLTYLRGIVVNGSLVGFDEYALKSRFDYEPPQQALWLTHPVRGMTFQEAIFADDPKPVAESAWCEVRVAA